MREVDGDEAHNDYSQSFNPFVYELIDDASVCLDIGCSAGRLGGALIKNKGCVVDGIDLNEDALSCAAKVGYRNVWVENLNDFENKNGIPISAYDYVILADVVEHLAQPEIFMKQIAQTIGPSTKIIVSVPNVAFIQNRINLLLGNWNYTRYGTLDYTHLRFFTISTFQVFLEEAGFKKGKLQPYNQFFSLGPLRFLERLMPGLFCYQILFVSQPTK